MTTTDLAAVGLDRLKPVIAEFLGDALEVELRPATIGPLAGGLSISAAPNSAAILRCAAGEVWIPAPLPDALPSPGKAPLYRINGHVMVMPFVRLVIPPHPDLSKRSELEYLTLANWLRDAFTRWIFPCRTRAGGAAGRVVRSTFLEALRSAREISPGDVLNLFARMISYAIRGLPRQDHYIRGILQMNLTPSKPWVRDVRPETTFNKLVQRNQVVTACLKPEGTVPRVVGERNRSHRIDPVAESGLDPFHTPEDGKTRLTGYLGVGVRIDEDHRALVLPSAEAEDPSGPGPLLSPSTAGIPFLRFDEPRRLLLGAKQRTQAIEVDGGEGQRHVEERPATPHPPGVTLRVGYLAWRGLNHEDAWIISESAAEKLVATRGEPRYFAIPAHELPPQIRVKEGDIVSSGVPLIKRRVAPAYLMTDPAILADLFLAPDDAPPWSISVRAGNETRARHGGVVEGLETWDLSRPDQCPADLTIHPEAKHHLREVVVITIRERVELQVGDKLANSHGHKGIVGAILPDDAMPRWEGAPLEVLIDPVSVLGRANWGQVREAIANAGIKPENDGGRSTIEPPDDGSVRWIEGPVRAIAGIQFVMRLDKHARDEFSVSDCPPDGGEPSCSRIRRRRLGKQDTFALWGYGHGSSLTGSPPPPAVLSRGAASLRRLLRTAGYDVSIDGDSLVFEILDLGGEPPQSRDALVLDLGAMLRIRSASRRSAQLQRVERWLREAPERLCMVLVLPTAVSIELPFPLREPERSRGEDDPDRNAQRETPELRKVRWLDIPPIDDRPAFSTGGAGQDVLTKALCDLLNVVRSKKRDTRERLPAAVSCVMLTALGIAFGLDERREGSQRFLSDGASRKRSHLAQKVLGQDRIDRSARATIAPLGPDAISLNEIVLPQRMKPHLIGSETDRETFLVWLKRNPVLHRWGLLRVRARFDDDPESVVIRLPASLLGPMHADFDGDTAIIHASIPGIDESGLEHELATITWDDDGGRPMFLPGKQYRYGLFLLLRDRERLVRFNRDLEQMKAPIPPCLRTPLRADAGRDSLDRRLAKLVKLWASAPSGAADRPTWWGILESHALSALASDPGIGLSAALSMDELKALPVVLCGAAKFRGATAEDAFGGRILDRYRPGGAGRDDGHDPVELMIESERAKGVFGSAAEKLLYGAPRLDVALIRKVQFLTEQMQQRALDSKSQRALSITDFRARLKKLLNGDVDESLAQGAASTGKIEKDSPHGEESVADYLKSESNGSILSTWHAVGNAMRPASDRPWDWVLRPARLLAKIHASPDKKVRISLSDPRASCWIRAGTNADPSAP